MTRKKQDEVSRRRRIAGGNCPIHGVGLVQTGIEQQPDGGALPVVACPRQDCSYKATPNPGSLLWKGLGM